MNETVSVDRYWLPHQLPQGTQLKGRYQLERVLGQGGFGITYLGWDLWKRVRVAIKEYYPKAYAYRNCPDSLDLICISQAHARAFEEGMNRFLREAQALQKLSGIAGVVAIFDFFQENNTAYIVMDYVEGVNLKDHVERSGGKLSPHETLTILGQVMEALRAVHNANLVHRDIAPDNIMLHPDKGPVLLDFGAARTVLDPQVNKDLSHSTEAIVKHGFAPIEQYHTRGTLGPWTDIYALCATAWYCMTGLVPEPVPSRMAEGSDPDWESIPGLEGHQIAALKKGMSVRTADRFADVNDLYYALFNKPQEDKLPRWLIGSVIAAAAVLAILIAVLLGKQQNTPPRPGTTETAIPATQTIIPTTVSPAEPTETITEPAPEPVPEVDPDAWMDNVMMYDPLYVFSRDKEDIGAVIFLDSAEDVPSDAVNLGVDGGDRVRGWMRYEDGINVVRIAAEGGINAKDSCCGLFDNCINLRWIDFGTAFHTEQATNMDYMFATCASLERLDVSSFDTSNVTTMRSMFFRCHALTELDVSNFDTSNVTVMYKMFSSCVGLRELDLRSFDTSSVENMGCMFSGCNNIVRINVSGFDVSNVYNMEQMFRWCEKLEEPDLSGWDVSSVTRYSGFMDSGRTINGRPWQQFFA